MKTRVWRTYLLDWFLLFILTGVLIRPLFKVKYLDLWASIESTFIADGRFLRDHWPHPNWQPNWYLGTRTDYIYPPALRYGTAGLAKLIPIILPVRAYHLYIAIFYCFGIAAVYLMIRGCSGSRWTGVIGALTTALVSPTYLFAAEIRTDAPWGMPYRLNVLMRYGEGPHMTALAWIPFAIVFSYRALTAYRPGSMVAAAFGCAMVVSNNFYGATALAVLFPVLVAAVWITHRDLWMFARAAAIAVAAYGLTAFWLVPSYIRLTLDNMRFVSSEGNSWSVWAALAAVVGFLLLADHFARGRREQAYLAFLSGAAAMFSLMVLGNHFFGFRIIGEASRLFPELDLVLIALAAELLRRAWIAGGRFVTARRVAVIVAILAAWSTSLNYLNHSRSIFRTDYNLSQRIEYQLQDWMAKNMPGARAMTAGGVRFWYNVWNDLPQLGGGSEQGLTNAITMPSQWEILLGNDFELSRLWLQVLGVDVAIVNERHSRDIYKDYAYPEKFRGKLPVLHDDGAGNIIYGVPRRYKSLARVVDRARVDAAPEIPWNGTHETLLAWHDVVENGPAVETTTEWDGTDAMRVRARVEEGQSVLLQISFDNNWRATAGGQRLPVRNTKLGLLLIDTPPGDHDIRLEFPTPRANWIGRAVTLLTAIGCFVFWMVERRRARRAVADGQSI